MDSFSEASHRVLSTNTPRQKPRNAALRTPNSAVAPIRTRSTHAARGRWVFDLLGPAVDGTVVRLGCRVRLRCSVSSVDCVMGLVFLGCGYSGSGGSVRMPLIFFTAWPLSLLRGATGRAACGRGGCLRFLDCGARGASCNQASGGCSETRRCRCCSTGGGPGFLRGCGWIVFLSW